MKVERCYCDLCDIEVKHPSVIVVHWVNSKTEFHYDICDECRKDLDKEGQFQTEGLFLALIKRFKDCVKPVK